MSSAPLRENHSRRIRHGTSICQARSPHPFLLFPLCASAPLRENHPRRIRHGTSICQARSAHPFLLFLLCASAPLRENHPRRIRHGTSICQARSPHPFLLSSSAPPRLCARTHRQRTGTGRAFALREALTHSFSPPLRLGASAREPSATDPARYEHLPGAKPSPISSLLLCASAPLREKSPPRTRHGRHD